LKKIADSGFLIAALDDRDAFHSWARPILEREEPPWLVCEPVLLEVAVSIGTAEPLLEMLEMGDLELEFELKKNLTEVRGLLKKYRDQPMDLADAAVVRMSELFEHCLVYTVDRKDFSVYRRHSRKPIPCIFPE
jgi:predicted nucleic acid-binding protein